MKKILFITLIINSFCAFAQRGKVTYFEISGSGTPYSLNIDAPLTRIGENGGYRIGIGYNKVKGTATQSSTTYIQLPTLVNYVWGEKHGFELGGGLSNYYVFTKTARGFVTYVTMNAMYRYQGSGGLNFRIGWTPIFASPEVNANGAFINTNYWFLPGLSLGWKL